MSVMRWGMAAVVMITAKVGAQSAVTIEGGAGVIARYGVVMTGVQIAGNIPLADPRLRLRLSLGYSWNWNTSPPGGYGGLCDNGCYAPSVKDELLGAELSLQRSFRDSGGGPYVTAGAGLYSSSVRVMPAPMVVTSTMAFGMEGGFGVEGRIGPVGVFGQVTVMYLGADRGSAGSSVLVPIMAGVRF